MLDSDYGEGDVIGFRSATWKAPSYAYALESEPTTAPRPLHPTLNHALAGAAREEHGITVLSEDESQPDEHRSYRALAADAQHLADVLAARGVRAGDRILIVLPTSFDFVVAFFAAMRLGAVPVPSYPPAMMEKIDAALDRIGHQGRHSGAELCLTDARCHRVLGGLAFTAKNIRSICSIDKLMKETAPRTGPAKIGPSDLAFIQYTSGSTGNPKGVLVTHGNVCANLHGMGQAVQVNRHDKMVSWAPLYHDMGLVAAFLFSVFFHLPITLMSPTTFLQRPVRWLRAISDARATMTPSPNFGYSLAARRVRAEEREGLDLSCLRVCFNAAEHVNPRTLAEFAAAFAPCGYRPEAMYPAYGLAETVVSATFPPPGRALKTISIDRDQLARGFAVETTDASAQVLVALGSPFEGHDLRIVDDHGFAVCEGTIGHIELTGPSVAGGYYRDAEATARARRGEWLRTGDLGFVYRGELYVTGRAKDVIIIRGHNYHAEDLERVAELVPGVRPGAVVAFGVYDEARALDTAIMVCETRVAEAQAREAMTDAIRRNVAEDAGVMLDHVVLVPPGTIPKTSSGKRQRQLTRKRWLESSLGTVRSSKLRIALAHVKSGAGLLSFMRRRNSAAEGA